MNDRESALREGYKVYLKECEQFGTAPRTFHQWAGIKEPRFAEVRQKLSGMDLHPLRILAHPLPWLIVAGIAGFFAWGGLHSYSWQSYESTAGFALATAGLVTAFAWPFILGALQLFEEVPSLRRKNFTENVFSSAVLVFIVFIVLFLGTAVYHDGKISSFEHQSEMERIFAPTACEFVAVEQSEFIFIRPEGSSTMIALPVERVEDQYLVITDEGNIRLDIFLRDWTVCNG